MLVRHWLWILLLVLWCRFFILVYVGAVVSGVVCLLALVFCFVVLIVVSEVGCLLRCDNLLLWGCVTGCFGVIADVCLFNLVCYWFWCLYCGFVWCCGLGVVFVWIGC